MMRRTHENVLAEMLEKVLAYNVTQIIRMRKKLSEPKRWNRQRLNNTNYSGPRSLNDAEPGLAQSNKECRYKAKSKFTTLKAPRHKKLSPLHHAKLQSRKPITPFGRGS